MTAAAVLIFCSVFLVVQGIVLEQAGKENSTGVLVQEQKPVLESYWPVVTSLIKSSWAMVEGRGKKGDKGGYGALMMMGSMFLMMGLTALAALSGKALAAAMAALLLAAMSLMRKGHHGGAHSYEIVSVPHTHHHRSLPEPEAYATSYGYENSAEALPTVATQIINNHHMSVQ